MSLVEVVVGAAIIVLVFAGIVAGFHSALTLVGHARAQASAIALGNERIEYIRSLPYDSVGTISGIPAGTLPQNEQVTYNGTVFSVRTLVQYVDAPQDGSGVSDTNGIAADYKRAKIELTWTVRQSSRSMSFVTNVVPPGIETVTGGGTLTVNVFDALAQPVDNAAVRIINTNTTSTIDVTSYTNAAGVVSFPGAPASGGYRISATRSGYSLDQTYSASSSNPNPNPPHVAVALNQVSTVNFAIDRTSSRTFVSARSPQSLATTDPFNNWSRVSASSSVALAGGALVLASSSGPYAAVGYATSTTVTPSGLVSWDTFAFTGATSSGTGIVARIYAPSAGAPTLLPDALVPGNAAGLGSATTSLASIPVANYPSLIVAITLSGDTTQTPALSEWRLGYTSATPVANLNFTLTGLKNIGTDAGGKPVPKYQRTLRTSASALLTVSNLEWDQYGVTVNGATEGYDLAGVCMPDSLAVAPDSSATTTLVLETHTANSLRVFVGDGAGVPMANADVTVQGSGAPIVAHTSSCGYAYVGGLSGSTQYDITASASGYTNQVINDMTVSGAQSLNFTLTP